MLLALSREISVRRGLRGGGGRSSQTRLRSKIPDNWEIKWEFSEKGVLLANYDAFSSVLSMSCSKIPDALEMGILPAYLGNRSPMADRDTSTSGAFIWPPAVAGLRPLKAEEIEGLAAALGKPVDRHYLGFWVSQSISNAVKLSTLPSARSCRDELMRVAREGRQWLQRIEDWDGVRTYPRRSMFLEGKRNEP